MSPKFSRTFHFAPRTQAALAFVLGCVLAIALLPGTASPARALTPVSTAFTYGDFETGGAVPQGWSVYATAPNRAVVATGVAFSGARALYVEDLSSTTSVTVRRKFSVTPGAEYHAQGYVFTKSGLQYLSLRFYDASGALIGRSVTPSTSATMLWSRVETRAVAPTGAASASVDISTATQTSSQAWWDVIDVIRPGIANGGFETTSTQSPVPAWSVSSPSGTSATITSAQARSGRRSLALNDASTTAALSATSGATAVFPGVPHSLRVWVRPTSGTFAVTVRYLGATRATVGSETVQVRKPVGTWSLLAKQVMPPSTAHWATLAISTSPASARAAATFDVIDLRPAAGAGVHTFSETGSVQPVDAFSNTNVADALVINGRAKLMSVVSGSPAEFQVADIETGAIETRFPLGAMKISYALAKGCGGAVYIGGNDGHLWRWAPGATSVQDLGVATPRSTVVWDLECGANGKVWGVSYPAAELWNYDPASGVIKNLGTVDGSYQYARSLAVDNGYAWVGLGSENPVIARVSLSNPADRVILPLPNPVTAGNIADLESLGRYLAVWTPAGTSPGGGSVASERRLYDTQLQTWDVPSNYSLQRPSTLDSQGNFYYFRYRQLLAVDSSTGVMTSRGVIASGPGRDRIPLRATLGGVDGEWLLTYDTNGTVAAINLATMSEVAYRVDFAATKMRIKSLGAGPDSLYVGGYGGSSLAVLSFDLASRLQYPLVPFGPGIIGEVEGTISHGSYQYFGTYTGAQIFRYDRSRPWVDGTNPTMVQSLGPSYQQDRPMAWATSGSRVFFGTVPKYGLLSGALGIFDDDTGSARVVMAPVKDQSVVALAASGDIVFGGTSRWGGLGATPTQSSAKVFAWNAATNKMLWQQAPVPGAEAFGAVAIGPEGSVWAAYGSALVELDPATGAVKRQVVLQQQAVATKAVLRNADLAYVDGLFYLTSGARVFVFDPATLRLDVPVPNGVTTPQMVVQPGRFYAPFDTTLKEFTVR